MSKIAKLSNLKIYSAINIPHKILEPLLLRRNAVYNIAYDFNSRVMLRQEEFSRRVRNCDVIVCSSFSHLVNKELLDSAGRNLKVFFCLFA